MPEQNINTNAVRLYSWLEEEFARMGMAPTAWTRSHGLSDATLLRWKDGVEPKLSSLQNVATLLDRDLVDLLLAGGWLAPEQVGGRQVGHREYSALTGIMRDPSLDEGQREVLLQVLDALRVAREARQRDSATELAAALV